MKIKDFSVGQTVFILTERNKKSGGLHIVKAVVAKVGRKYVTISGNWEQRFKESGNDKPYLIEQTEYGTTHYLFPSEQAAYEYNEREELKNWVRTMTMWPKIDDYTLAQLRAVKKILGGADNAADRR